MNSPYLSGFTFIKNGLTLGYPIKESIESIEPLCDEIIVNVGYDDPSLLSDDGTYQYLRDSFPQNKFKFLKNYWEPEWTLGKGGVILSRQTNLALAECRGKYCQYIQGDEVLHEEDLELIREGVRKMENDSRVEGLVFKYLHFYGNVDIIKHTRNTYRREVRLIRNGLRINSWLDAQGFRHQDQSKLQCLEIPARIFHYGWARKSAVMKEKVKIMNGLYKEEGAEGGKGARGPKGGFEYQNIWGLKKFTGTHPRPMENWIRQNRNQVDLLSLQYQFEWKDIGLIISDFIESLSGYRMGEYKNFRLLS